MEILWWWAPAAVVTLLSIVWISWYGRDGRGAIDRDEAVKRMAQALANQTPTAESDRKPRPRDRSTGIAVRPTRSTPTARPQQTSAPTTSPWSGGSEGA